MPIYFKTSGISREPEDWYCHGIDGIQISLLERVWRDYGL